ncbi:MAG: hypothetical protein IJ002_06590 [Clostridia bacterium]|nr:hypothetical protein [Clostridia bacterium]
MKIELKLGAITAKEFADSMQAKLYTLSKSAPDREIELITDEIGEISHKTLFVASEDNSLAEMMAAAKNGAYCVICTKAPESLEKIPDTAVIECDNIRAAFERFAKVYARRGNHKTIALTGAKGKTRTGEFVYSVLEEMYKVHKCTDKKTTEKNDALALLDIPSDADFFLMELKIHDKRDIARLGRLVDCDVGIVTTVNSSIDERANVDVLAGLKEGGEVAFCAEDDVLSMICRTDLKTGTVSVNDASAELHAENIRTYKESMVFDIVGDGVCINDVEIHFTGEENITSALFAALVGLRYNVPAEKIKTGLKNYHSSELGVEIFTVGGITFIVDTSSATPDSVKKGIDTLCDIAKLHKRSRKIALVGDIRDFGQDTRILHEKMGAYIVEKKIDKLFTFGVAAEQIGVGARRAGMCDKDVSGNLELFSPVKSAEALAAELREGDVLLIRLSRKNAAEEIEKYLRTRFEK